MNQQLPNAIYFKNGDSQNVKRNLFTIYASKFHLGNQSKIDNKKNPREV